MRTASSGFTFIEILVTVAVAAALSAIGIAGFVSYSRSQALTAATSDVVTMLHLAKSKAQSQVKPSNCNILVGYKVGLCQLSSIDCQPPETNNPSSGGKDYALYAVCSADSVNPLVVNDSKKLSNNNTIQFETTGTTSTAIFFNVITGGVTGFGNIKISGYGNQKTITVDAVGNITVQ